MNNGDFNNKNNNSIIIENREKLSVSGVNDVVSFDDKLVLLVTSKGNLAIEGEDLKITVLDTEHGNVRLTGRICGIIYEDDVSQSGKKRGLGKIFG